mmetsp:Transcript_39335/g.87542  ORF Transcript_39335/g.87542 Transcript_39335/m.87542 type:complete len:618 (+) Transcript_39335:782-2635(+)
MGMSTPSRDCWHSHTALDDAGANARQNPTRTWAQAPQGAASQLGHGHGAACSSLALLLGHAVVLYAQLVAVRRQVHGRVATEESIRLEHEAEHLHRHDREVLHPRGMSDAKAEPHHRVCSIQRRVLLSPLCQAHALLALHHVVPRRVFLVICVRGDPQVARGKVRTPVHQAAGHHHHAGSWSRQQLVGHGLGADGVEDCRVLHAPVAGCAEVDITARHVCVGEVSLMHHKGIEEGVLRACRQRPGLNLADHHVPPAVWVVHCWVNPHAEEVLVHCGIDSGSHPHTEARPVLAHWGDAGAEDAAELHLKVDGAVLEEVIGHDILIVHEGADLLQHQLAGPPHLRVAAATIVVLPQDARILLVQADGILDDDRLPLAVIHNTIKVLYVAQAVTAQGQGVSTEAKAIVTDVEGRLASLDVVGVPIGHRHLHQAHAVQHRPHATTILVAHLVQHKALPGIEPDTDVPVLPLDQVALHTEAGALWLHNVQGLDVAPERLVLQVPVVVGAGRRHLWHLPLHHIDVDHTPLIEVHNWGQINGVCVLVVAGAVACVEEALHEAPVVQVGGCVVAGPGVTCNLRHVLNAIALLEQAAQCGVLLHDLLRQAVVIRGGHGVHALQHFP